MNATDYLHFKTPTQEVSKNQEGEPKLIPHPDNGRNLLPSSLKLVSRSPRNGSSN